jgi:hypothetical protein
MKDALMLMLILGASGLGIVVFVSIYNWLKEQHEMEEIFKSRSPHKHGGRHNRDKFSV